jgi:broad specificity phosphatase PhoE
MKIVLARHGETSDNQSGRYTGWLDPSLTDRGARQAASLAGTLRAYCQDRGATPSFVVSSDLLRAAQTAQPLADVFGVTLIPDRRLRETDMGRWTGLTYSEVMASDPDLARAWYDDPMGTAPPGGETLDQLYRRVSDCLLFHARQVAHEARGAGPAFIAVTHGGVIRVALAMWAGCALWSEAVAPGSFVEVDLGQQRRSQSE